MNSAGFFRIIREISLLVRNVRKLSLAEKTLHTLRKSEQVVFGTGTYGVPMIYAWDNKTKLVIGNYCSIAADVRIILGGEHRLDWISTFPFSEFPGEYPNSTEIAGHPSSKGPIEIGNDVWIGNGVTILSGLKIGDGAVIAAGSVVVGDIPPYAIAAGVPAKVVKFRFEPEVIARLLQVKWWNWPQTKINRQVKMLMQQPDLETLSTSQEDEQ
jgi:acetyltransferase-like isoleucine patch superfamily enzyme